MATPTETVFVSSSPGLEPALAKEAQALGAVREVSGGLELVGGAGLHQEACLRLRSAGQVLWRVFEGPASGPLDALLRSIDVGRFGPVRVEATSQGLEAAARKVWRTEGGGTRVLLRLEEGRLTVSVDCAGEPLFRRGYRQELSHAPMRETLAAGMLLMAGYSGEEPLWDPMCGSGTLLIEGAWIARRRAPGSMRPFAFESWKNFDALAWAARKSQATTEERALPSTITGSDMNAGSLGVARRNAKRAGVFEQLTLSRLDALTIAPAAGAPPGLLVANLPYGKRVGGESDLTGLHRNFGKALKTRFSGWRAVLLTGDPEYAEALGLPVAESWKVDNGGLDCVMISTKILR